MKSSVKNYFCVILLSSMADKKTSLFNRYEDPTGEFSNQSLQFATWYVTHRELLRKITIIALVVWSVLTLGSSLFFIGKYFIVDYPIDQANLKNLSYSYISPNIQAHFQPSPLTFSSPQIFSGIGNKYDLVVNAKNPNTDWIAYITYQFEYGGGATEPQEAIMLPLQDRPVIVFGHESDVRPGSVNFHVISVRWERVDPHTIPDPVVYIGERVNVSVSDLSYTTNSQSSVGSPIVQFSLTNNSLFDFWEFSSIAEFKRGGEIVGFAPVTISQFMGGQTQTISLGILSSTSNIDSVEIIPTVNVFDLGLYMTQ